MALTSGPPAVLRRSPADAVHGAGPGGLRGLWSGLGKRLSRRPAAGETCAACSAPLPPRANFCGSCGASVHEPESQALYVVDRTTGLFNDRFLLPRLDDELSRVHLYGRTLGLVLVRPGDADAGGGADEALQERTLQVMAAAVVDTVSDVDTPGVLQRRPPTLLTLFPEHDLNETAQAAQRVMEAVNAALVSLARRASLGIVCVLPGRPVTSDDVLEAVMRSLVSGRPELLGR